MTCFSCRAGAFWHIPMDQQPGWRACVKPGRRQRAASPCLFSRRKRRPCGARWNFSALASMQVSSPRLAFYGDDFTGATDTLATLAGAGQNALLFLRVPDDAQLASAGALDCVGIAGAARSMSAAEQQSEMTSIGAFMARLGAAVNHYKVCSTFDSSPDIGDRKS